LFESIWIARHGAPVTVGGDPEWGKQPFKNVLDTHSIRWEPRPARRHNKTGSVERKIGILKPILLKLALDNITMDIDVIISRGNLLGNLFAGSRTASSFELARGYTPNITGLGQSPVSDDMVQAHREKVAQRSLHSLLSSQRKSQIL